MAKCALNDSCNFLRKTASNLWTSRTLLLFFFLLSVGVTLHRMHRVKCKANGHNDHSFDTLRLKININSTIRNCWVQTADYGMTPVVLHHQIDSCYHAYPSPFPTANNVVYVSKQHSNHPNILNFTTHYVLEQEAMF